VNKDFQQRKVKKLYTRL